jgi:SNF2 family DNA or RNA helicase
VPQQTFATGDVVTVRGTQWLVEEAVAFPGCTLLGLSGLDEAGRRRHCKLLHPFDRPITQKLQPRVRAVTRRRWLHSLHSHLTRCRSFAELHAAQHAAIDIFAFQLEPALSLVRGLASRVLLADEVGLGKTIQAGLMLAELQDRGWCERALVLTPAGLRQQWAEELARRFGIRAAIFDAVSLRVMAASLPFGLNPWTVEPVAIASIDFIKQPEVHQALAPLLWDMLVVDEAHQVAVAPQRAAVVRSLARRARHVVLLTATPHAGDERAYQALCAIGQLHSKDPIALFRRTRLEVGFGGSRRVHLLPVRLSDDEREMHRLLGEYVARVWQIAGNGHTPELQMVTMVLSKRAFSSAASLAVSVERRLALLSGRATPPLQSVLPFDVDEDASDADPTLAAPAFACRDDETSALERILTAAQRAQRKERKVDALRRLLRRITEPAVVFTEYRDTLDTLSTALPFRRPALLHGGLSALQRQAALEAFTNGPADLLLATDAGSEGLNLQGRCRLVINLELPWNPIRLEQRIGRVDRLGQTRTVHAIHLFASDTAESTVLAGLVRRVNRIRTETGIALDVINAVINADIHAVTNASHPAASPRS